MADTAFLFGIFNGEYSLPVGVSVIQVVVLPASILNSLMSVCPSLVDANKTELLFKKEG